MDNNLPIVKNTNFTVQFVLEKLSSSIHSGICLDAKRLQKFEIKELSDASAFTSNIYRLQFAWNLTASSKTVTAEADSNEWPPTSVILKVPCSKIEEMITKNDDYGESKTTAAEDDGTFLKFFYIYLTMAHKHEIAFYNCFHRLDPANQFLPKLFYGADFSPKHREGLIIIEDLSDRARSVPVLPGLNDAQVHAALAAMARVHATAWTHPSEWVREVLDGAAMRDCWTLKPLFLTSMIESSRQLATIEPNFIGPLVQRLLPLYCLENIMLSFYYGLKYGFSSCIVHGDLWSPNILWSKNSDGQASDTLCAIIDWQTVHSGNPCEDICRLLALNTTSAYRRANTEHLLAFYAQKVADFMGPNGAPFTAAQLRQAYVGAMPYTMMGFCFGATIFCTMDSVVGAEGSDDREFRRTELFRRVQHFMEDTEIEFKDQL